MTNNEIITELYNNHLIRNVCAKFNSFNKFNQEDLEQHIYLTLLEMPNKKLNELYSTNQLLYYIYYIIKAQCCSPTSTYNKLYSNYKIDVDYNKEYNDKYSEFEDNEDDE